MFECLPIGSETWLAVLLPAANRYMETSFMAGRQDLLLYFLHCLLAFANANTSTSFYNDIYLYKINLQIFGRTSKMIELM